MRLSYVRSIVPRAPRTMAFVSFALGLLAIGLLEPRADAVAQSAPPSVATAVTVPGAGPVAALPASVTYVQTIEGIHEYRLANGLQVLLLPDASAPKMTVNIVYRVGSRHESYGETGMAHLLEHLVFKGTPRHPNIPAEFKQRGASFNGTPILIGRTISRRSAPAKRTSRGRSNSKLTGWSTHSSPAKISTAR